MKKRYTRTDVARLVRERLGFSRSIAEVDEVLAVAFVIIGEKLSDGDRVAILRFGCFERRVRAARPGRDLVTGETTMLAESSTARFTPAARLKRAMR